MERLVTITKEFSFHAAHRLPNHDGACRDLHGHTYRCEVSVTGRVKGPNGDADEGMVLDFGVLKQIYEAEVEPYVEHKYLNQTLESYLPKTIKDELDDTTGDHLGVVATSENIATWLFDVFCDTLDPGPTRNVRACQVRLWETPTSYAEVGSSWRP